LSPYDGEPLRYLVLDDRIVLTCYCWAKGDAKKHEMDFLDQRAGPIEFSHPESHGIGLGASLWNPDRRGLPFEEKKKP
jgi:hypothetical protein